MISYTQQETNQWDIWTNIRKEYWIFIGFHTRIVITMFECPKSIKIKPSAEVLQILKTCYPNDWREMEKQVISKQLFFQSVFGKFEKQLNKTLQEIKNENARWIIRNKIDSIIFEFLKERHCLIVSSAHPFVRKMLSNHFFQNLFTDAANQESILIQSMKQWDDKIWTCFLERLSTEDRNVLCLVCKDFRRFLFQDNRRGWTNSRMHFFICNLNGPDNPKYYITRLQYHAKPHAYEDVSNFLFCRLLDSEQFSEYLKTSKQTHFESSVFFSIQI